MVLTTTMGAPQATMTTQAMADMAMRMTTVAMVVMATMTMATMTTITMDMMTMTMTMDMRSQQHTLVDAPVECAMESILAHTAEQTSQLMLKVN